MPRAGDCGRKFPRVVPQLLPLFGLALGLVGACATSSSDAEGLAVALPATNGTSRQTPYRPGTRPLPGQAAEAADDQAQVPDGMTLATEKGVLHQSDVDEALGQHTAALRHCYERAGVAQKYVGGRVVLRFFVGRTGQVSDIHVAENGLGNYAVERCLVIEGRAIVFPAPGGQQDAEFDYPIQFRSGGELAVVDWDASVFAKDVAALSPALGVCGAGNTESIRAVTYVQPGGAVGSVGLLAGRSLDSAAAVCLVEQIRKWRLPDDRDHIVRVTFPLVLTARTSVKGIPRPAPPRARPVKRVTRRG